MRSKTAPAWPTRPGQFHLTMITVWACLLLTLIWWKTFILRVAAMSLYASITGGRREVARSR